MNMRQTPVKIRRSTFAGSAKIDAMPATTPFPIRVLVVEDDPRFAAAFAQTIAQAPDLVLAGRAAHGAEGRRLIENTPADVLLVDLGLPDADGVDLIRYASERQPNCASMVITVFGDEDHVLRAIEAGATGYLLKAVTPPDVAEQIRLLRAGGSPLSPLIARRLLQRVGGREAAPAPPVANDDSEALSEQEWRVLDYIAKGFTFEEASRLLGVSIHTTTTYARRVYRKLQVSSKTEAIFEARRRGLLRH
jgi:DNA-binding NarL/FixJ family response regulator